MANYLIVYLGGNPPATPEEGQKHFTKYKAWLGALGDAVISPANPLKNTHAILPSGEVKEGGTVGMSGYTIISSDSLEAALEIAQSCPFLEIGGSLEVSEMVDMKMS